VHRTGIPPELDALVLRMLAREPRDRYASCDDVLTELVPMVQQLRGHAQSLRAFVAKVEAAPPSDAATVPMPKLDAESSTAEATVVAKVTPADQWQEPTRPMAPRPVAAGSLLPGVVAFHRPRHWWRRLHSDRRVVLAAGGVVLAVALTIFTIAFVAWPHAVPVPHAALPVAMPASPSDPLPDPAPAAPAPVEAPAGSPAVAPPPPVIRATPLVEPPRPPQRAVRRRAHGRQVVH